VGTLAARVKPILKPIVRMVKPQTSSLYRAKGTLLRQNFSREYVIQCVEGSLRRLQTDYIDLFQLHSPPKEVVKSDEVFESLITLRRHGKIRHFGVSCETIEDAMLCLRVPGLSALQVEINLLDQSAIPALLPAAKQAGVAIIARQPFASGRLFHDPERAVEQIRIARYRQLAEQHDLSLAHLALQFVNQLEGVSVVIAGVNTPIHLADSLSALSASPLTTDQMSILCEILTAVP
jgi:aryl-alcohol dehydrogenase-like predicted oxidoreductase